MDWFRRIFALMLFAEDDPGGGGDPAEPSEPAEVTLPEDVPKYMAQASREQKEDKDFLEWSKSYSKFPDVLKTAYEAETKLKSITPVPGENASDEEKAAYLKAIGVPESEEGYEIEAELDEESLKEVKKFAHDNALTPAQAKELGNVYANLKEGLKANAAEEAKRKTEATVKELREEWKDDFDKNLELVGRAARSYFVVEGKSVLDGELGSDPRIVRGLYRLGKDMVDTPLGPHRSAQPEKDKSTPKTFEYPD